MGFELPPGDPDAIDAAITKLTGVATDVATQIATAKSGFAGALSSWHGPRSDDFRAVSGGLQLQVSEVHDAATQAVTTLTGYSKALRHARDEITHLTTLANKRQQDVGDQTSGQDPDSTTTMQAQQHANQYVAQLEQQAEDLRTDVRRAAQAAAAAIGSATTPAVPGAEKLSPAEVGRKVHETTGVSGLQGDIDGGTLTEDDAWKGLDHARSELDPADVREDGSVDWGKVDEQLKQLYEKDGQLQDGWAVMTAPSSAWALSRLALAAAQHQLANKAFSTAITALLPEWKVPGVNLDGPGAPGTLDDVMEGLTAWTDDNQAAYDALVKAESTGESLDSSKLALFRNGLPKWAELGVDGIGVLGYLADGYTLLDPNAPWDDKVDAGVNAVGLGMLKTGKPIIEATSKLLGLGETAETAAGGAELLETGGVATELAVDGGELAAVGALDASVGWVPVVGWGLVAVTAGYEVYKHWDEISDTAGHVTDWVSDEGGKAVHALGDAASSTEHFISDHLPHVSLW